MDGFFDTLALYGKGVSIAFGGIGMTLGVTAGAIVIGMVIGLIMALGKMSKHKIARWPASIYVEIIRGTPLFVQILILAYGVPYLVNTLSDGAMRFNWNPIFMVGILAADSTAALIWRKSSGAAFRRWTTVRRKWRGLWE